MNRPGTEPVSRDVSPASYRDFMSKFPAGVAIITAVDRSGELHGMTCTSLASVTIDPPTLLVCLDTSSGTLGAIRDCGQFAVNLLRIEGRHTADIFSTRVTDRFSQVPWRRSRVTGQPWLLDGVFAWASCFVSGTSVIGDHEIVLGEVLEVVHEAGEPLVYGMRQFHTLASPLPRADGW